MGGERQLVWYDSPQVVHTANVSPPGRHILQGRQGGVSGTGWSAGKRV